MLDSVRDRSLGGPASASAEGTVLIATHGAGRGRRTGFLIELLKRIAARRPHASEKVVAWLTGTPLPSLDRVRTIIFMLGDPITHYPLCHAEARRLARDARERGIQLINPPFALNNSVKSRQAALWKEAGLPCAGGEQASDEAELRALIVRARYPIILRFDDYHQQDGVAVCRGEAEALEWTLANQRYPAAVLEYIDTRDSWRRAQPGTIFADYFHKRRSMVFGSKVLNNHIFFSSGPIVGSKTSTFGEAHRGGQPNRIDEMVEADIAFSRSPPEQPELMQAALRALGLGMAAIDYSTRADGSIVLWEANPFFQLPHWSLGLLAKPRRLEERLPALMDSMIDELEELAGGSADG